MLVQDKLQPSELPFLVEQIKKESPKFEDSFSTPITLCHQDVWHDSHSSFESWLTQNNEDIIINAFFPEKNNCFALYPLHKYPQHSPNTIHEVIHALIY